MTAFTRTSPRGQGELPSVVSEVGGLVIDIIGLSGQRLIIQVAARDLIDVPQGAATRDGFTIANVPLTAEQIAALGGGIRRYNVRLTVFDGDSEPQSETGGVVTGFRFGSETSSITGDYGDDPAETTSADGSQSLGSREGFGDGTLDTGWIRFSSEEATGKLYAAIVADGAIRVEYFDYTPETGDAIDWDAGVDSAQAAISVGPTYVPIVHAIAAPDATEGGLATITVTADDADDDGALTYAFDLDSDGSFEQTGAANSFSFRPTDEGARTVTVRVTDVDGVVVERTATVNVANAAPTAGDDAASVGEGASVTIDALANDRDPGADTLAITGASVAGGGSVAVVDNRLLFSTGSDFEDLGVGESRAVTLTYMVSDGDGGTDEASVLVTVTGANDAPTADADAGALQQDGAVTVAVAANDADVDGDALAVTAASVRGGRGTVSFLDGAITFAAGDAFDGLGAGETETVMVDYTIGDGNGGTASATLTLTVTGTNDGPVAVADTGAAGENGSARIAALANDGDVDGDALAIASAAVRGGRGSVAIDGDALLFSAGAAFDALAAGQTETVVIDYAIGNGNGGTASSTATVTITGANDAPVAADEAATVAENGRVTIDALANDRDVDAGDRLSLENLRVAGGGSARVVDGRIVYDAGDAFDRLRAGETATVAIDYDAVDAAGARDGGTATVTVTGVNDAPVAAGDAGAVRADGTLTLDVLANDRDVDGGALSLTGARIIGEDAGRVSVVDGKLVFETAGQFAGLDVGQSVSVEVAYGLSDGQGGTAEGRAVITVNGFDRPDRTLTGTNQSDHLVGGDGFDDTIRGLAGHDRIEGGAGNDRLFGEAGHDALSGGAGRDVLDGGHGHDALQGGEGADRFVVGRGYGHDVVLDFSVGEDRVVLADGVRLDRARVFDVDGDGRADTVLDLSHGSQLVLLGVDQPVTASVLFG